MHCLLDRCNYFTTGKKFCKRGGSARFAHASVGADRIRPNVTEKSRSLNGSSFPTQTVGADRIRPQHKAPLRGACAGSTYSSTLQGVCVQPGTCGNPVAGGCCPPLQGVCVQPGTCGNPGLRADSIRPYRAYTLIRVLPEIRGYGRMLSAPTGVFLKLPPVHKKDEKPAGFFVHYRGKKRNVADGVDIR